MLTDLQNLFPNFPEEVLTLWLLPYAEGERMGLPPTHPRWDAILHQHDLQFWQQKQWTREEQNFNEVTFSASTLEMTPVMRSSYRFEQGAPMYTPEAQRDRRYLDPLEYLVNHGTFPEPICLLEEEGAHTVIDGSHRFAAWEIWHDILSAEYVNQYRELLRQNWGIEIGEPAPRTPTHEVWVAR